ncbi:MAG: PHP domain-containing protein [Candidatus Zixiibacteriota bacterium]|nr:MAG: PHP domain-containing protein [candidate division Zixibacteria bacterium]
MPDNGYHEIIGVIHIHSSYSDGTKKIEEIAKIGEHAGLDFLMFSDHNTLRPLQDGHQRFYGKTAVLIGYEIQDVNDENHYLAFGLDRTLEKGIDPAEYVSRVRAAGGLGIIAHPDEVRDALPKYPCFPWTRWDIDGYDGLEIWNHMSAWMESLKRINMLKMAIMPRRSLRGPTDRVLKKWDEIAKTRPVAGIGSADVHAHIYRKGLIRLTIFPYKVQFRSIRTHLLLDQPLKKDITSAKEQIFNAIRKCGVFVSNFRWGDARGFQFFARRKNRIYRIGETVDFSNELTLNVHSPRTADIRLIKDGRPVLIQVGSRFEIAVESPGIYRVELYINKKGWIYSNHIRIHPKKEG